MDMDIPIIDIFEIPLYYIGFNPNKEVEAHYKVHGFRNVNHFKAVDGRKMEAKKLHDDNLITIRSYDDLMSGRSDHSGLPTLGAVGCTLSHYELWKLCVDKQLPYIIIVEEDGRLDGKLNKDDINNIRKAISKDTGIFLSSKEVTNEKKHRGQYYGTHFYVATIGACKALMKKAFPIDIQTDSYLSHLYHTKDISIEGYMVSVQKSHKSSIQEVCWRCILPKGGFFYLMIIMFLLLLIIGVLYFRAKFTDCKASCGSVGDV